MPQHARVRVWMRAVGPPVASVVGECWTPEDSSCRRHFPEGPYGDMKSRVLHPWRAMMATTSVSQPWLGSFQVL